MVTNLIFKKIEPRGCQRVQLATPTLLGSEHCGNVVGAVGGVGRWGHWVGFFKFFLVVMGIF